MAETTRWMAQLASALAHLHALRVVHRDVKTSNLMLSECDDLTLIDFGLAYHVRRAPPPPRRLLVARHEGSAATVISLPFDHCCRARYARVLSNTLVCA